MNALDQARREIATRYDFKGARSAMSSGKDEIASRPTTSIAPARRRTCLESKAVRRNLSLKIFEWGTGNRRAAERYASTSRSSVAHQRAGEGAREAIRDESRKQAVIQGDAVRVSAKSKDDLQAVIADLRGLDYP